MMTMIGRRFCRFFRSSSVLFGRWTAAEDQLLLQRYDELGPAWTLLALGIRSRSPIECRRRYLQVSGALEKLTPKQHDLIYNEGYELHPDGTTLVKVPMERIVAGPFAKLAAAVEPVRFRRERRKRGWSQMERLAVQEGVEQYGPNWSLIARKLQFRSATQCRNMMIRRVIKFDEGRLFKACPSLLAAPAADVEEVEAAKEE